MYTHNHTTNGSIIIYSHCVRTHTLIVLPASVTSQLAEARDLLAKAQSVRGSDDVVGLMVLALYKNECTQPCSLCHISTGI